MRDFTTILLSINPFRLLIRPLDYFLICLRIRLQALKFELVHRSIIKFVMNSLLIFAQQSYLLSSLSQARYR